MESRILHVGCGPAKIPGSIGIDINPESAADVIHDLQDFPYPFRDNSFDLILCDHVLEHLSHLPPVLEELHRICAPAGRIEIRVPHFSSIFYYRDPTHMHPFSLHSLDYFVDGTPVSDFRYTKSRYRLLRAEFSPPDGAGSLKRLFYRILNRYGEFYEKHLAFLLPRHLLFFEITPIK
jgi:ubiquinone/menaquinone biosynthesis C-methylase UbiE